MEYPHSALIRLRTILANLYPTQIEARIVVNDVDLDPAKIEFTNKSIITWFHILERANMHDKVDAIIKRALVLLCHKFFRCERAGIAL